MRGTTGVIAAAALLLFGGCSKGSAEEDVPEPGPLQLSGVATACIESGGGGEIVLDARSIANPADIPLTIDEVTLQKARNLTLVAAVLVPRSGATETPAVDATITEKGEPGNHQRLRLRVRLSGEPASLAGFSVDYHNVDGRFRAVNRDAVEVLSDCPATP